MNIRPLGRARALLALAAAAFLAGCGGGGSGGSGGSGAAAPPAPVFDNQAYATVSCMAHQTARPTAAYRTGPTANTGELLTMLRYYTANGSRAYCDGRAPTATDLQWLRLYVAATGTTSHVSRWAASLKAS